MKRMRFFALVSVFLAATAVNVMAQNLVKGKVSIDNVYVNFMLQR